MVSKHGNEEHCQFIPDYTHEFASGPAVETMRFEVSIWNPYPFTNPPFYVISHGYDMDITTSCISFGKMSYQCHIHVISVFQKRYIWIYSVYPKLKKLHLVYTRYFFSCHKPYLSMSYPCHKFVRLSGSGPQMKFSRKLRCGSSSAYHGTAFIKHYKIYLPPPRARTPPLPPALGGDATGAGSSDSTDQYRHLLGLQPLEHDF